MSGCTIIRNAIAGAFCLFESMATMLPVVDDMHVMDMGSIDGTLYLLHEIASANKRIHIHSTDYSWENASVLADASNDVIALANHDSVLFWQADEIWHESLVQEMLDMFDQGHYNLVFWRYQLRDNFQNMYWLPHTVHRVGDRRDGMFHFVGDGMSTDTAVDVKICGGHETGWPQQWDTTRPASIPAAEIPTHDMILDVSSMGAFRNNIVQRGMLHHPLWGKSLFMLSSSDPEEWHLGAHMSPEEWSEEALQNPNWTKCDTPFDIPAIMRYHVGKVRYEVRPELVRALKEDTVKDYLDGI